MTISPLAAGAALSADNSKKKLSGDLDNFLKLLTTQLSNQDPLSPMDSNEFTAQLVRFTQVEQSIAQNKKLEQLVQLIHGNQSAAAVNYIGKKIEAEGSKAELAAGQANWTYTLPATAAQAAIVVRNSSGVIVFSGVGANEQGKHTFTWDGKDSKGNLQPPGTYQISVNAKDATGSSMVAKTGTIGKVTGVENVDGETMLAIGKVKVPFDSVIAVTEG